MPSRNAPNVANTFSCGSWVANDSPSVISAEACSSMLISNRCVGWTSSAAFPNFVDGFRSHDTKKQRSANFFATGQVVHVEHALDQTQRVAETHQRPGHDDARVQRDVVFLRERYNFGVDA